MPAQLHDLSGGGASILLARELDAGKRVQITFEIPEGGEVVLVGRVVRSSPIHSVSSTRYVSGVSFERMEERIRTKIIRYVFSVQRELTRWAKRE